MTEKQEILKFPKDFLWGTATSAHQVEGNNINSDWWVWEQQHQGRVLPVLEKNYQHQKFVPSGQACDHYHRYQEDFDLLKKMGNNVHRLSIEWARIEPKEGQFDYEELQHYREVLTALKKRGIKVMLTLHHFTNPFWFANKGGWQKLRSPFYFSRYVKFVAENIGDLVDFWITINEPAIYMDMSYTRGFWPPQKKDLKSGLLVYINMARAHRRAYKIIHQTLDQPGRKVMVGSAVSVMSFASYKKHSLIELFYVHLADRITNHSFYDLTKHSHDFLGVNYYFRVRLKKGKKIWNMEVDEIKEQESELSDMGTPIYPHGIFDVLMDFKDFNLPIYITENGIAAEDDRKREKFIVTHLAELHHAIQAGVNVCGYFHWSSLDNFEWDKSFGPKFGLVEVDFKTLERKPKPSYFTYQKICQENGLPEEMLIKGWGISGKWSTKRNVA